MISAALKRRCPPRVRMAEIFPDWAQRVTVFGLTRKISATSLGVRRAVVSMGCSCMEAGPLSFGGSETLVQAPSRHSSHNGQRRRNAVMTRTVTKVFGADAGHGRAWGRGPTLRRRMGL